MHYNCTIREGHRRPREAAAAMPRLLVAPPRPRGIAAAKQRPPVLLILVSRRNDTFCPYRPARVQIKHACFSFTVDQSHCFRLKYKLYFCWSLLSSCPLEQYLATFTLMFSCSYGKTNCWNFSACNYFPSYIAPALARGILEFLFRYWINLFFVNSLATCVWYLITILSFCFIQFNTKLLLLCPTLGSF